MPRKDTLVLCRDLKKKVARLVAANFVMCYACSASVKNTICQRHARRRELILFNSDLF